MSRPFRLLACLAGVISLPACVQQQTVVQEQSAQGTAVGTASPAPARPGPVRHVSLCAAPAGSGPYEPIGAPLNTHSIKVHWPAQAVASNLHGCAGIRFRIDADGTPIDASVLTEYPAGYALGDAVLAAVTSMRWAPRNDLAWHFAIINRNPPGGQHI